MMVAMTCLLVAGEGQDREESLAVLSKSVVALCDQIDVSSLHVTFNTGEERDYLSEEAGFLARTGIQYVSFLLSPLSLSTLPLFRSEKTRRLSIDATK